MPGGKCGIGPKGRVPGFGGWPQRTHRTGHIDDTQFFGPQIIFRHVDKPPKGAKPPGRRDGPSGFLENLPVKRAEWRLSRVDAAARQLDLWLRLFLERQQKPPVARQRAVFLRIV